MSDLDLSDIDPPTVPPDEFVAAHLHLIDRDPDAPPPLPEYPEGIIPDPGPAPRPRNPQESELHQLIKNQPLLKLYRQFIGKGEGRLLGGREQQVSCPHPNHLDKRPSACINIHTNVGYCYACDIGFDQFDIYAWNAGYDVPGYKDDGSFGLLREELGLMLGYHVHRDGPTEVVVPLKASTPDEGEPPDYTSPYGDPDEEPDEDDEDNDAEVISLFGNQSNFERFNVPPLDFLEIFDERSLFIRPFVETLQRWPFPDVYHGALALMGVGLALGNQLRLSDHPAVRGNLMVCLVGASGVGKTSAILPLTTVLREALPEVRVMGIPNSAEVLLDLFCDPIDDPTFAPGSGRPAGYNEVRGLVKINELASLVSRSGRLGNDTKQRLMDLYDSDEPADDHARANGTDGRKGHAENHFMSLLSTTQPDRIPDLLTMADKAAGFLNRWFFVFGERKEGVDDVWRPELPDTTALSTALKSIHMWARGRTRIIVDDEAKERFRQWMNTEFRPHFQGDIYGRVDLLFKKLCLLIAADKRDEVVTLETMEQALAFWPYLRATYGGVDESTEVSADRPEEVKVREKLLRVAENLQKSKRPITWNYVRQACGNRWWDRNLGQIDKQWKLMVSNGTLKKLPPPAVKPRGRPPEARYRVEMD